MDTRGLSIRTDDPVLRQRLGGVCLSAMEALEYRSAGLTVTVEHDPHRRSGVTATAHAGSDGQPPGIRVSPEILADVRVLVWVLQEEVAHRYLNEIHGIPHGGDYIDRFAQEGFGGWFQWRLVPDGFIDEAGMTVGAISDVRPTPALGGTLGRYVGQTIAGSRSGPGQLAAWMERPDAPDAVCECVRVLLEDMPRKAAPSEFARAVAQAHAAARG
jgi:hypothetical protein